MSGTLVLLGKYGDDPPGGVAPSAVLSGIGGTPLPPTNYAVQYVTRQGNDSNDGKTWGTAKLTVAAGLAAIPSSFGAVELGVGTFTENGLSRPSGVSIRGCGPALTTIKLANSQNVNVLQDAGWGTATNGSGGMISALAIDGNKANQTGVYLETLLSAGATVSGSSTTLTVVSTTGFASSGQIWVGRTLCTYTGKTGTTFTGVTTTAGSITYAAEARIVPFNSQGHGIALQSGQTVVRDVIVQNCIGSGICAQGPTGNAENELSKIRSQYNNGYNFEIGVGAIDGRTVDLVGSGGGRGDMIVMDADWVHTSYHPVGVSPNNWNGRVAPWLLRICAPYQQFDNFFADTAPYGIVSVDMMAAQWGDLSAVKVHGKFYQGAWVSGASGPAVQVYGPNGTTTTIVRGLDIDLAGTSRLNVPLNNGPSTFVVGAQTLPVAKLQVTSALGMCPLGTSVGGTLGGISAGFTYTGVSAAAAMVATAAAIGDTSLVLDSATGFDTSGTVAIYPGDGTAGAVFPIEVTYTGISGNTLTGIPASSTGSITAALPVNTGVGQHYLTGCSGGTGTVADKQNLIQTGRAPFRVQGHFKYRSQNNWNQASPWNGNSTNLDVRMEGFGYQSGTGYPNPRYLTGTVAVGTSSITVTHNMNNTPKFWQVTPTADPQQRWWATADSTNITITLAANAAGSGVTFNIMAASTPI